MGIRTACHRLWIVAALLVAFATGGREIGAQSCPVEKDRPSVLVVHEKTLGKTNPRLANTLNKYFLEKVREASPGVNWVGLGEIESTLELAVLQQKFGIDDSAETILGQLGSPFVLQLEFDELASGNRRVTCKLADTRKLSILRRVERIFRGDDNAMLDVVESVAAEVGRTVLCDLLQQRERPAVPLLTISVSPQEVAPGSSVKVRVKLIDQSDGQPQFDKDVRITHRHGASTLSSLLYSTDADGVVSVDLNAGTEPGPAFVEATWTGSKSTTRSNPVKAPYRVWEPIRDIAIRSAHAALFVGGAATVTATVQRDGAPVQGAATSFTASGGSVGASAVATDAAGNAATSFQAPDDNSVVDVTATTPAPPGKRPRAGGDLTATLSFVVDGGVTLSLNAADTVEGGTSAVTADLVVGGKAVPATEVTFALSGAGALSAASAPTNEAGRAEVVWAAPAGNSSATITAEAVVDGQRYTKSVAVSAGAVGGSMAVKVLPGYWDESLTTVVATADQSQSCFSTLSVTNACRPDTATDYGGQPADPPVSIRADAGSWWVSLALTQPRPAAVVAELTGIVGGTNDGISANAILELTFDGPGTVDVVVDDPVAAPSGPWWISRPAGGATTFQGDPNSTILVRNPDRTGSFPVTEAGKLEIQISLGAYTRNDPAFSGTRRMTLTFRPQ